MTVYAVTIRARKNLTCLRPKNTHSLYAREAESSQRQRSTVSSGSNDGAHLQWDLQLFQRPEYTDTDYSLLRAGNQMASAAYRPELEL